MAATAQQITAETMEHTFCSPYFVVRIAGLPVERATELSTLKIAQWASDVLALEDDLSTRSQQVVDVLYNAVKATVSDPERERVLLSLKRDVYNLRVPKNHEACRAALTPLDPALVQPALEWLDLAVRLGELRHSGEALLRAEVLEKRGLLKRTLADATFRKGLFVASQTTEKSLDAYLAAPNSATSRRLRLSERSALLYLFRTTCKTSPFSTLTPVSWGEFRDLPDHANGYINCSSFNGGVRTACMLNLMILGRLSYYLLRCEDLALSLPVQLIAPLTTDSGRVRYLRRTVTITEPEARQAAADGVKIVSYYLPLSGSLRRVLDTLHGALPITGEELIGRLSSVAGQDGNSEVRGLVRLLIELGLLVNPDLWISLSTGDPFSSFLAAWRSIGHPQLDGICSHVEEARRLAATMSEVPAFQRRALVANIRSQLTSALQGLGRSDVDLPQTLVYEDGALDPATLELPLDKWRNHLEDLSDLQSLCPVLETNTSVRLVMKGFFKAVYGKGEECQDVLSFCEVFRNDYYEQYQQASWMSMIRSQGERASINHFNVPELDLLDDARRRLSDGVKACHEANLDARELVLDRELLKGILAGVPRDTSMPISHCFATQAADMPDGLRLVINRIYSGFSHLYSRFLWLLSKGDANSGITRLCREQLIAMQPPDTVFVQLPGGVDTNLNIYPELAAYEITFPGGRCTRPLSEQIAVTDLFIRHDPVKDRLELRSRSIGRRVIPLYLGFMIPTALPDLYQLLLNFAPLSFVPSFTLLAEREPDNTTDIIYTPRIRYGGVILSRASWRVPAGMVPRRSQVETDAEYMLSLLRWRRKHNIPQRVFLRTAGRPAPPPDDKEKDSKEDANAITAMTHKPMYVDFNSYFSAMLVDRALSKGHSKVNLAEPLPDQSELCLHTETGSYVTEFMIEMNRVFTEVA